MPCPCLLVRLEVSVLPALFDVIGKGIVLAQWQYLLDLKDITHWHHPHSQFIEEIMVGHVDYHDNTSLSGDFVDADYCSIFFGVKGCLRLLLPKIP